jgi:ABC-type glycerol-3-phosphate transport system permease component
MRKKIGVYDVVVAVLLAVIGFTCLIPILNAIAISFSDKTSAAVGRVVFWPINFNVSSYIHILQEGRFFQAFWVSIQRCVLGGLVNVALIILTAFPLSKDTRVFRQRNIYMWVIVFTMLFNGGLVPSFLLVRGMGLLDSIWSLILPGAVPVFSVIILMNFFKGIPKSLEEAAIVDGANPFTVLTMIFVPLALPSIATVALFSLVGHWNAFFDGKIFINTLTKQPLSTYIQSLTVELNFQQMQSLKPEEIIRRLEMSNLTFNSAKVVVSMVPILIIYPLLQKYFVTGIVMGAVKE